MEVKIKRLISEAVIPQYSKEGDAGLDLIATSYKNENGNFVYGTGLAIEIPLGYVGLLYPRSSISKTCLQLTNSVGVIDSGYRGEIIFKFDSHYNYYFENDDKTNIPLHYDDDHLEVNQGDPLEIYKIGDKIGQLIIMPYPKIEFKEVEELSNTDRGVGGFGSTDLKI